MDTERETKNHQLLEFRVDLLETQYTNILKLVQETHDAVTTMRAKMGDNPFQCSIHSEKLNTHEKRISDIEDAQDESKKFVYKAMGGLAVIVLIISVFIGPSILDWLRPSSKANSTTTHEITIPGTTNKLYFKDVTVGG